MRTRAYNSVKYVLAAFVAVFALAPANAQDEDGIYGDIYQEPDYTIESVDTTSPLDGYSTVDDYYPDGGYNSSEDDADSSRYTDENGNTVVNNYYGDVYQDSDYGYAARISRFHRPMYSYGYYDDYYTNLYWYNNDPYYYGSSIYSSWWPLGYSMIWGNASWYSYYGWMHPDGYYSPYCYGGWNYGYGNYWNGYSNGLAYGGYYNTYDGNSSIYYGHRGSSGSNGSGYRSVSFADVYNKAAASGKANHSDKDSYLQLANAAPAHMSTAVNKGSSVAHAGSSTVSSTAVSSDRKTEAATGLNRNAQTFQRTHDATTATATASSNPYQRQAYERATNRPKRTVPHNIDSSRPRVYSSRSGVRNPSATNANGYQRGDVYSRSQVRTNTPTRGHSSSGGNLHQTRPDVRSSPRGNSRQTGRYSQPNNSSRNSHRYSQPSKSRKGSQTSPSRSYSKPSRSSSSHQSSSGNSSRSQSRSGISSPSRSSGSIGRSGSRSNSGRRP